MGKIFIQLNRQFLKKPIGVLFVYLLLVFLLPACGKYVTEKGIASFYSEKYNGRATASGEIFRDNKMTAAHKTLPFGTKVKVTNLANGKKIKVRINDRGPFVAGRIIDLSKKAAEKLDMINAGISQVMLKYKMKKP